LPPNTMFSYTLHFRRTLIADLGRLGFEETWL
jgi:hypothetical protein